MKRFLGIAIAFLCAGVGCSVNSLSGPCTSDITAPLPLNATTISEGQAVFVTRITYQTTKTFTAAPVMFQIDKTPPTISMGTYDGRTAAFVGPGNATATVTALITDSAAGVD